MLHYLFEALEPLAPEMKEVICVTNDKYAPHFESWQKGFDFPSPVRILNDGTRTNETRLGAIQDIDLALKAFKQPDDVLILAGDNIFDFDLAALYQKAKSRKGSVTVGCTDVKDRGLAKQYGILELDSEERILKFYEKPQAPSSTLASTGIYFFSRSTFGLFGQFLAEKSTNGDAPGYFVSWLIGRVPLYGEVLEGIWYDIGDLASLKKADEAFAAKK
jgi:glucose-1-phosphate thymidylyltransferase